MNLTGREPTRRRLSVEASNDGNFAIERVENVECGWAIVNTDTRCVEYFTSGRYAAESWIRGYNVGSAA